MQSVMLLPFIKSWKPAKFNSSSKHVLHLNSGQKDRSQNTSITHNEKETIWNDVIFPSLLVPHPSWPSLTDLKTTTSLFGFKHNRPSVTGKERGALTFPLKSSQGHWVSLSHFFIIRGANNQLNAQDVTQHSIHWHIISRTTCDHLSFLSLQCALITERLYLHFISDLYRCDPFHFWLLGHNTQVSPFVLKFSTLQDCSTLGEM